MKRYDQRGARTRPQPIITYRGQDTSSVGSIANKLLHAYLRKLRVESGCRCSRKHKMQSQLVESVKASNAPTHG